MAPLARSSRLRCAEWCRPVDSTCRSRANQGITRDLKTQQRRSHRVSNKFCWWMFWLVRAWTRHKHRLKCSKCKAPVPRRIRTVLLVPATWASFSSMVTSRSQIDTNHHKMLVASLLRKNQNRLTWFSNITTFNLSKISKVVVVAHWVCPTQVRVVTQAWMREAIVIIQDRWIRQTHRARLWKQRRPQTNRWPNIIMLFLRLNSAKYPRPASVKVVAFQEVSALQTCLIAQTSSLVARSQLVPVEDLAASILVKVTLAATWRCPAERNDK